MADAADDSRPYYRLAIDAVDGVTVYCLTSDSPQEMLRFLRQYDHEGSSIMLNVVPVSARLGAGGLVEHEAEAIYAMLMIAAKESARGPKEVEPVVRLDKGSPPHSKEATIEDHPAYAVIGANRSHGGGVNLYGSDFSHHSCVTVRINRSSLRRNLSSDWVSDGDQLIEVQLSEAQWASFVSTLNSGIGTQCTLQSVNRERVPEIARRVDRRAQAGKEMTDNFAKARAEVSALRLMMTDPRIPKIVQKQCRDAIHQIDMAIGSSVEFVSNRFDEQMETTVEKAKMEVSAYGQQLLSRLGTHKLALDLLGGDVPQSPIQFIEAEDQHEPDHQPADQRDGGDAQPADRSGDSQR